MKRYKHGETGVIGVAAGRLGTRLGVNRTMQRAGVSYPDPAVSGLYLNPPEEALVVSFGREGRHPSEGAGAPGRAAAAGQAGVARGASTSTSETAPRTCYKVHTGEVSAMPAKTCTRFDLVRFLDQLRPKSPAGSR